MDLIPDEKKKKLLLVENCSSHLVDVRLENNNLQVFTA
jgi:hypothetical protein